MNFSTQKLCLDEIEEVEMVEMVAILAAGE